MKLVVLLVAGLVSTNAAAQTGAVATRHVEQGLVYAAAGKKAEAEAERTMAIEAFDAALNAGSSDVTQYLNLDCRGLLQSSLSLLTDMNAIGLAVNDLVIHHMSAQVGEKIEPLAEKYRRLQIDYAFDLSAIIHKGGCPGQSLDVTKDILSNLSELKGVSAFYSQNGALRAMPMKNPPPLPKPPPALRYPVPP